MTVSPERQKFLQDVLITALEGGIGYWSLASIYKPEDTYAAVIDLEDDKTIGIDQTTIQLGIDRIVNDSGCKIVPRRTWLVVLSASAQNDTCPDDPASGDIDAEVADVIVQVGLFGEIRYG